VICGTVRGYVIYGAGEGMLSVSLAKVVGDWVWRNGRIDNMLEVGFGWFDKLVLEKVKARMVNTGGGGALHGVINFSGC
jgi:hypothetical protein